MTTAPPAELTLPANPNAVSFAADAADVLADRTWADVQRLAERVARAFHDGSGLPVMVGAGWRVALDRKNQRRRQLTLYFVFDGPATAAHLDALDAAIEAEDLGFGAGSIERVPANGVAILLQAGGAAHLLVDAGVEGPDFRRLDWQDGQVRPVRVVREQAQDDEWAAEFATAVGRPAPYGDAERETERMRLAFARHFSVLIIEADGVVRDDETAFMHEVFPDLLVERLGLSDPQAQAEYLQAARTELAGRLGHHDKLALIGLFFSACYADGSLDAREMRVLKEAGDWLGLRREEVVKYLRRFW